MAGAKGLIIAIDGPAGSGKSTTARLLAGRMGSLAEGRFDLALVEWILGERQ